MNQLTRRHFTRAAGAATALSYSRVLGASDRVRLGYIGLGNRGDQVHEASRRRTPGNQALTTPSARRII
jgi:hypothetical protein